MLVFKLKRYFDHVAAELHIDEINNPSGEGLYSWVSADLATWKLCCHDDRETLHLPA